MRKVRYFKCGVFFVLLSVFTMGQLYATDTLYLNRGNSFCRKGKYDWAISDYNKALELNPKFTEAYYNRGLAYYGKGEYDNAIRDFDKALEISPVFAEAYNNRGISYNDKG